MRVFKHFIHMDKDGVPVVPVKCFITKEVKSRQPLKETYECKSFFSSAKMEAHLFIHFLGIAVVSYQEVTNTKVILE